MSYGNSFYMGLMAGEQLGYIKKAAKKKFERKIAGKLSPRDRVNHLDGCRGVYLIGSSELGCYKIGYAGNLRERIGSYGGLPITLDVIMWRTTPDGNEGALEAQLHRHFSRTRCSINGIAGEWFRLDKADLDSLVKEFRFDGTEQRSAEG